MRSRGYSRRIDELLTIGEVAARAGIAHSALRYYETEGLVHSERTAGNQRRYHRSELRRIAFIREAQRVDLSLDEIREALGTLPAARTPTEKEWARLSQAWRPRLDAQIADLGCRYVLVGHSERRALFGETDGVVAAKFPAALKGGACSCPVRW